ncbi:MAG: sulfatase modifying factor 1 (C-alpha-formyglycine- generating enzyme 1) [Elusimicrobia bacterium CG08_land_8_20_14_0_20_59_10]|nr:MAG: sulfatase modifying factor 1 (C-alpha-formyglycine- generating enzyme 1) [Elusimicrobia bacterium CG08_land_8_20_14_0_20_59_10]
MEPEKTEQPTGAAPEAGNKRVLTKLHTALIAIGAIVSVVFIGIWMKGSVKDRVLIPAGEFLMGAPEGGGELNEHPQHKVYLDAYYMNKTEVTNAAFKKFIDAVQYVTAAEKRGRLFFDGKQLKQESSANWKDPLGNGKGIDNKLDRPVVRVSWNDADAYCKWAGGRLPTEAEWEKAARGGTNTQYSFGDEVRELNKYAWYSENSNSQEHPVGLKEPNLYGLYDMHGNVWEWVADRYAEDYYSRSPAKDPKGPDSGNRRVLRGGGAGNVRNGLRAAFRAMSSQGSWSISFGFRCAFTAQDSKSK